MNFNEAHLTYLVASGVCVLLACNVYYLIRHWSLSLKDWETKDGLLPLALPIITTAFFVTGVGSLGLGYSPAMKEHNAKLEGSGEKVTLQALETETRNQRDVLTRTRLELDILRQENKLLKEQAEREKFSKDVATGQDSMMDTRKRLLNRTEKDSK